MTHSLETLIRHLRLRRGRERRGVTLAEGVRLVEEALAAGRPIRAVVIAPALEATPRGAALAARLRETVERVEVVDDRALAALATTEHPQGVIAVIEPAHWTLDDIDLRPPRPVVLCLDAVQDPGNVGTMLRSAWALGARGVIALPGTAELANPKVLRASMGAVFRRPALSVGWEAMQGWCQRHQAALWVAAADGEAVTPPSDDRPLVLVVGNEGAGVSAAVSAHATRRVAIPLAPDAESLNVGVAAGILLYEVRRDR